MKKTPTYFVRNPDEMRYVLNEVHPECKWVAAGEGAPTRKYDGTCVRLDDGGNWWARREVKPLKTPPEGFVPIETDEVTGKAVGWEPIYQSAFVKFWDEAFQNQRDTGEQLVTGTYELCGPKVNGNPEGYDQHVLIRHADADQFSDVPRDFNGLRQWLHTHPYEGIVWHHPDGRMAKLKARDFPQP